MVEFIDLMTSFRHYCCLKNFEDIGRNVTKTVQLLLSKIYRSHHTMAKAHHNRKYHRSRSSSKKPFQFGLLGVVFIISLIILLGILLNLPVSEEKEVTKQVRMRMEHSEAFLHEAGKINFNKTIDWQSVRSKEKFYVYSAFYVEEMRQIRLIGATTTKSAQPIQCLYYDNEGTLCQVVSGRVKTIREHFNLKYSACFIICPASSNSKPAYISITTNNSAPLNLLKVIYPPPKPLFNFTICVKPIHYNYNNIIKFTEWMEYYINMGVQEFTFYNHTIGPELNCLLSTYEDKINVLPWNLNMTSQKEIRTEGIFASLNDCVYRYRGRSEYLIIVDFDEMIVPRRKQNLSGLMEELTVFGGKNGRARKYASYVVQNAFFYLLWADEDFEVGCEDCFEKKIAQKMVMGRKTRRTASLHRHRVRSKYICIPNRVVEAGNHFIWEALPFYYELQVPSKIVALHHYRTCEFGGTQCIKSLSVIDRSAWNFTGELIKSVSKKLNEFFDKCGVGVENLLSL